MALSEAFSLYPANIFSKCCRSFEKNVSWLTIPNWMILLIFIINNIFALHALEELIICTSFTLTQAPYKALCMGGHGRDQPIDWPGYPVSSGVNDLLYSWTILKIDRQIYWFVCLSVFFFFFLSFFLPPYIVFSYCAVTTDIQLTLDDKPLILLIAQLTQILNNRQFFFFLSFIICFIHR